MAMIVQRPSHGDEGVATDRGARDPGGAAQLPAMLITCAFALWACACSSIGPARMGVDRDAYLQHLRQTDKQQLLANIVGMHKGDAPVFLTVTSVISQYTRESSLEGRAAVNPAVDSDAGSIAGAITLRETPTITYTPLAGESLAKSVLAPMSPAALMGMVQSGWAIDSLFRVAVRSINGIRNSAQSPIFFQQSDDDFERVLDALRRLQASSALSIRVHQQEHSFTAQARLRPQLTDSERADLAFLQRTLGVSPGPEDISIAFGEYAQGSRELAISTRSVFEVIAELGAALSEDAPRQALPPIVIHHAAKPARDAYVSIRYGDGWYWIDGGDTRSQQNFMIAQVLMYLTQSGQAPGAPLLTVPAG